LAAATSAKRGKDHSQKNGKPGLQTKAKKGKDKQRGRGGPIGDTVADKKKAFGKEGDFGKTGGVTSEGAQ